MLSHDFNNGKKLNLNAALAVFVIVMGFLFLLDAESGAHTVIAASLVLFGFAWYFGSHFYGWWARHHHHHH
ncbi:MAG: hypothetical protein V7731_12065 [Amphritea sp.]